MSATSSSATSNRSPAIDPADAAARGSRAPSPTGAATEAERAAAVRAAEKTSDDAPKLTTEQAKTLLLDAARAFDPLRKAREHPLVLVGAAAGVGAVLGSSGSSLFALGKLASTGIALIKPLTGILGQIAATTIAAKTAASSAADAATDASAANV